MHNPSPKTFWREGQGWGWPALDTRSTKHKFSRIATQREPRARIGATLRCCAQLARKHMELHHDGPHAPPRGRAYLCILGRLDACKARQTTAVGMGANVRGSGVGGTG